MPSKPSPVRKAEVLMTGVAMGESPRWHENRLWFSDWGAQEILAVDPNGKSEVRIVASAEIWIVSESKGTIQAYFIQQEAFNSTGSLGVPNDGARGRPVLIK